MTDLHDKEKGKKIDYGSNWIWYVDEDRYIKEGFVVTRGYLEERMKNWGRKIERVHIEAMLEKILKEYKLSHNL